MRKPSQLQLRKVELAKPGRWKTQTRAGTDAGTDADTDAGTDADTDAGTDADTDAYVIAQEQQKIAVCFILSRAVTLPSAAWPSRNAISFLYV